MTQRREMLGKTHGEMARLCGCSKRLLEEMEYGCTYTHPGIAAQIAHYYILTLEQYNDLVPENRRATKLPPPKRKNR